MEELIDASKISSESDAIASTLNNLFPYLIITGGTISVLVIILVVVVLFTKVKTYRENIRMRENIKDILDILKQQAALSQKKEPQTAKTSQVDKSPAMEQTDGQA